MYDVFLRFKVKTELSSGISLCILYLQFATASLDLSKAELTSWISLYSVFSICDRYLKF